MELTTASRLIQKGIDATLAEQRWADLGAGGGLFTRALSCMLPNGSEIIAVDRDGRVLKGIQSGNERVVIRTQVADFVNMEFPSHHFDGILIANALHYVKDQSRFVEVLFEALAEAGRLIILEYELSQGNAWVPYPVTFRKLEMMCSASGFGQVIRLDQEPSVYHRTVIYSALIQKRRS